MRHHAQHWVRLWLRLCFLRTGMSCYAVRCRAIFQCALRDVILCERYYSICCEILCYVMPCYATLICVGLSVVMCFIGGSHFQPRYMRSSFFNLLRSVAAE